MAKIGEWTRAMAGAGLGAGLMFLSDPISGRRRRALIRDRFIHWGRMSRQELERGLRDLEHRTAGQLAGLSATWRRGPVSNALLVERVRARAGRVVHHQRELSVTADGGSVTLHGKVAPFEKERLLEVVAKVPGVREVRDALELAHLDEAPPAGRPWTERVTPAARLMTVAMGVLGLATMAARELRR